MKRDSVLPRQLKRSRQSKGRSRFSRPDLAAWAVVAAFVPLLPAALGTGYYLNAMNFIALYSMVAIGLCLLTGFGGQLSMSSPSLLCHRG